MTSNDVGGAAPEQGGQIARALAVLEAVAEHGSSTARGISEATGIPLPSVYRIAQELIRSEYLVHLRAEKRFALGYQLHHLAPEEQEEHLSTGPLRAHTDRTLVDPAQLRSQLAEIAERGIAWEHQEFVPGTSCLAATIKADDRMLVGTGAVSAPAGLHCGRSTRGADPASPRPSAAAGPLSVS